MIVILLFSICVSGCAPNKSSPTSIATVQPSPEFTSTPIPTNTSVPTPEYTPTPKPTDTPVLPREPSRAFDGFWRSDGHNYIADIRSGKVTFYDVTDISCLKKFEAFLYSQGSDTLFDSPFGHEKLSLEGDKLVFSTPAEVYITHSKLSELPSLCLNGGTTRTIDPVINFEIFWHTFQENYAFFDLRGVDWQKQYDTYRPRVKVDMSQSEFFTLMSDILAPINDGHVNFSTAQGVYYSPGKEPDWVNQIKSMEETIINTYLGGYQNIKVNGNMQLRYGELNDSIGYIEVVSMHNFDPEDTNGMQAAAEAIDQALKDLGDVKAMIVDVRFNGGGSDDVAWTLANRFADQRRVAFSFQAKEGDGLTSKHEVYLEPDGEYQFTKPVFVLISNLTMSAAEVFLLAMRALPHVTLIGERTRGCFALTIMGLPNGWFFGLNNEVFTAADGKVYEGIGIPPNVEVGMNPSGFLNNKDDILNKALELASAVK